MGNTILKKSGKFLNMFETNSGWEFVSRRKTPMCEDMVVTSDAVVIIPIILVDNMIKLVVISEWREPLQQRVFGFPAGLKEKGESISDCARRELKEETGYSILQNGILKKTSHLFSSEGLSDETITVVYALCDSKQSSQQLDYGEDISVFLATREYAGTLLNFNMGKIAYFVLQDFVNTGFDWLIKSTDIDKFKKLDNCRIFNTPINSEMYHQFDIKSLWWIENLIMEISALFDILEYPEISVRGVGNNLTEDPVLKIKWNFKSDTLFITLNCKNFMWINKNNSWYAAYYAKTEKCRCYLISVFGEIKGKQE